MKRVLWEFILLLISVGLCACGQSKNSAWQEQYDLGMRYLSEGNYEEAIIAFTAAIEIDPNRAEAYIGRGDAYVGLGTDAENLSFAINDYKAALKLDSTLVDVYLKLAALYISEGNYEEARALLETGYDICGDFKLREKFDDYIPRNAYGAVEFTFRHDYVEFDELDAELQEMVVTVKDLVMNGNYETVLTMLQDNAFPDVSILTIFQEYKIELDCSPWWETEGDRLCSIDIEIRPEEGPGYTCWAHDRRAVDTTGREHWMEYYLGYSYSLFDCKDWQRDGDYENHWIKDYLWKTSDGDSEVITHDVQDIYGTYRDGLMNGTFTTTNTETESGTWHGVYSNESFTYTTTDLYEDNVRIERDGEACNEKETISESSFW